MAYGTFSVLDTLASSQQSVAAFGEDNAFKAIEAARIAHNKIQQDMLGEFVTVTTDRLRRYGGTDTMSMDELDEYGSPDAQKIAAGSNVGFPLRKFGIALQWTRTALQVLTASELASAVTSALTADSRRIIREIKRAIFTSTNASYLDRYVDNVTLPVKALVNADSAPIPLGPNGETFTAATHTHYLGTASFVAADLTSLIEAVLEHYNTGQPVVYINRAQETAIRAFTGFTAYVDARIIPATNANAAQGALDPVNLYDRSIGIFGGAEIIVKPWVPASYVVAMVRGQAAPVVMRVREGGSGDLTLVYEDEAHPLRARAWEREVGFGIWNRVNGAVLFTTNATYAIPTLAD